ncbi:MAG: TlpA disulfide reductase family protein, partial [Phycisphaerales bacterium]|nr:TlpA disulfide reductase family protein [Phycisphaerales bacterium]
MLKIIALCALATINCISFAHLDHAMNPPQDASDQPEHPSDHPEHPSDQPEHPSDHPEHPSDHPEHPSETESSSIDETEVNKAKALLTEVHKVYKEADGINETLIITYPNPMGETETFTVNLLVGKDSGSVAAKDQITFVWLGGKVIASIDEMKGGYVEVDAPDGFLSGINAIIPGGGGVPTWSIALRESDDYDQWVKSFDLFGLPEMPLLGITTKTEADKTVDVLEYGGEIARIEITINEDRIVSGIVAHISQPGMPEMKISLASKTTFAKLSEPIIFESGDRKKYDSLQEMMMASMSDSSQQEEGPDEPKSKLTGNPAPDFTLELMDGSGSVTLSDLKGQVVVLDFWATWCSPCRKGLPALNKFDEWVQEQGLKVQVFAVNIWERGDPEAISEKV